MHDKKFYVTTPIYYVTARPHLGSLYSTLLADVAARWHKLKGYNTFFLTGTDEHGQKIVEAAQKAHQEPQAFVDSFIESYREIWSKYAIQYDYFIRTTDKAHVQAVQFWLKKLIDSGDIYKSFYSGYYCTPCETYVLEKEEVTGQAPLCPTCDRVTAFISEESYFFRLSAYQDRLLAFYTENPDFIVPQERSNEVISFVKSGLKDLSISRSSVTWGIPFPDDTKHVTYVWADALNNYISAIGYGHPAKQKEFAYWWPADLQVMGKDIVRFHAVFWPAFLMASGLALPRQLLVHGWIKVNNQKMSKSFGNVVDPEALLSVYGADPVRYYLVAHMAITQDAEFSTGDLEQRNNSDLANDLGNLINRLVTLAHKQDLYELHHPVTWGPQALALRDNFWNMLEQYTKEMDAGYFYKAVHLLWKYIHDVNAYFHAAEPWKMKDKEQFQEVLSATVHSIYGICVLLVPVMPTSMEAALQGLGMELPKNDAITELSDNPWNKTFLLKKTPLLFKKFELPVAEPEQPSEPSKKETHISIEDFAKVSLLVGTIEQVEEVSGSDKLLKLQVNFGPHGMRQVLSGVKKSIAPAALLNKQALFVANLAPRKLMGLESQGMLLTAHDDQGNLQIMSPVSPVPNGSQLK